MPYTIRSVSDCVQNTAYSSQGEICRGTGTQFCSKIVRACCSIFTYPLLISLGYLSGLPKCSAPPMVHVPDWVLNWPQPTIILISLYNHVSTKQDTESERIIVVRYYKTIRWVFRPDSLWGLNRTCLNQNSIQREHRIVSLLGTKSLQGLFGCSKSNGADCMYYLGSTCFPST